MIIVRSRFVSGLRPRPAELVVEAIILSLVVQLIVEALAWLITVLSIPHPAVDDRLDLLLDVLLYPGLIGACLGWNLSQGWNRSLLRRLSVPVSHPIQRGHDFAFGQNRKPCFVILTFEDGTVVHGWFGEESLAASDAARSDLYLERIYDIDEHDQFIEPLPGRSALLSLSGVRSIEFLDEQGDGNEAG